MMKLIMATALATVTLLGTVMESAEAAVSRGSGNTVSGSRVNQLDVDYNFELFQITPGGDERIDEDKDFDDNMGIFTGAIESFKATIYDVDNFFQEFDEVKIPEPTTLDLKAILSPNERIEYILSGEPLESRGVTELALIIDDLDASELANLGDEELIDALDNFDDIVNPKQAVNSLEYIIQNELLGKINKIRVSSKTHSDESFVYFEKLPSTKLIERVVQVPESNVTTSLLILGALGANWLLKRNMNGE